MEFLTDPAKRAYDRRPIISDLDFSPLPLGAQFFSPSVPPKETLDRTHVFGLLWAKPYGELAAIDQLTYDPELQVSLPPMEGPWDPAAVRQLATSQTSIEPSAATGTITVTGNAACPDRDTDTDPSDRYVD